MNSLRQFMETNATLMLALLGTAICFEGAHDPQAGFASGAWGLGGFAIGMMWRRIFG